jgi:hypothetical protein
MVYIELRKSGREWFWWVVTYQHEDLAHGTSFGFVTACRQARTAYLKELKKEH